MKRGGFTLMELLIALSIFSVMALCLYSTFSGGIRIWQRQEKGFQYNHNMRLVLDAMTKELRNAINYSQPENKGGILEEIKELGFKGEGKALSFISLIGEDIAKIDYVYEDTADKRGILKKKVVLQKEGFKEENQKEKVLLENIEDLSFEYAYRSDKRGNEVKWRTSFLREEGQKQAGIPIGVRMTLGLKQSGREKNEIIRKTVFIPTGVFEEYKGI